MERGSESPLQQFLGNSLTCRHDVNEFYMGWDGIGWGGMADWGRIVGEMTKGGRCWNQDLTLGKCLL